MSTRRVKEADRLILVRRCVVLIPLVVEVYICIYALLVAQDSRNMVLFPTLSEARTASRLTRHKFISCSSAAISIQAG